MAAPAQYAVPVPGIIQEMTNSEGFSNGVWNSIICHYLDQAGWIAMPELKQDDGGRPDLLVFTNADPADPVLIFEGKHGKSAGDAAWDKATLQAIEYMQSVGRNLALVALGAKCRFITQVAGDDRQVQPDYNNLGRWKKGTKGTRIKLDITADAAEIHDSFMLIRNNAAIP